jgi:hypothetical protein
VSAHPIEPRTSNSWQFSSNWTSLHPLGATDKFQPLDRKIFGALRSEERIAKVVPTKSRLQSPSQATQTRGRSRHARSLGKPQWWDTDRGLDDLSPRQEECTGDDWE